MVSGDDGTVVAKWVGAKVETEAGHNTCAIKTSYGTQDSIIQLGPMGSIMMTNN